MPVHLPAHTSANPPVDPAAHALAWHLCIAAVALLIALCLAWELWLAPTGRGTWAIKVLPLLPALWGLWQRRLYTFRWLSLLLWLYFCEGVVRGYSERGISQALALGEVALSLLIFAACVRYIRTRPGLPA